MQHDAFSEKKENFLVNMLKNIIKNNGIYRLFTSNFSTTSRCLKADDRKELINSTPRRDQGTEGEKSMDIDNLIVKK